MTDQQKATASHLYGNTFCQTPYMERLAQEGVLFEHAITPHPLCAPARVSFWTSQFPHSHGARRNQTLMPSDATHAFKIWKEADYQIGLIGKNHCFESLNDLALFDTWCEISHGGLPPNSACRGMEWFRPIEGVHAAHQLRRSMKPQNPQTLQPVKLRSTISRTSQTGILMSITNESTTSMLIVLTTSSVL
jgi:arylsulfatase A-like enzyme